MIKTMMDSSTISIQRAQISTEFRTKELGMMIRVAEEYYDRPAEMIYDVVEEKSILTVLEPAFKFLKKVGRIPEKMRILGLSQEDGVQIIKDLNNGTLVIEK